MRGRARESALAQLDQSGRRNVSPGSAQNCSVGSDFLVSGKFLLDTRLQVQTSCLSIRPRLGKAFRQPARSIFLHRNINQQSLLALASIGTNSTIVDRVLVDHPHQCRNARQETTTQGRLVWAPVETNSGERMHDARL